MSELHKSFAKAQLARLPTEVPVMDSFDEREEEGEEQGEEMDHGTSSASSTSTVVPSPTKKLFERPNR